MAPLRRAGRLRALPLALLLLLLGQQPRPCVAQAAKLVAGDARAAWFGYSVSLEGDRALVGAAGEGGCAHCPHVRPPVLRIHARYQLSVQCAARSDC